MSIQALVVCSGSILAAASLARAQIAEVEPNEVKGQATHAVLAPGEMFSGEQSGFTDIFSSEVLGSESRDIWRVSTSAAAAGIYKHVLVNTTSNGHMGALMGQGQTDGVANNDDSFITFQDLVWYGFGKGESVMIAVLNGWTTGDPTGGEYTFQLQTTAVEPNVAVGVVTAGQVSITVGAANGEGEVDADTWLYDANFNLIPGAGSDDSIEGGGPSVISRDLAAGDYYLAIGLHDLINNQTSPIGEFNQSGQLLDFPDAVTCNNAWNTDAFYEVLIADADASSGDVYFTRVIPNFYEVAWVKFTVSGGGAACAADLDNGSGTGTPDGGVDINDLLYFLGAFESGVVEADLDNGSGTGTPDGGVDINDLLYFLVRFEAGC